MFHENNDRTKPLICIYICLSGGDVCEFGPACFVLSFHLVFTHSSLSSGTVSSFISLHLLLNVYCSPVRLTCFLFILMFLIIHLCWNPLFVTTWGWFRIYFPHFIWVISWIFGSRSKIWLLNEIPVSNDVDILAGEWLPSAGWRPVWHPNSAWRWIFLYIHIYCHLK